VTDKIKVFLVDDQELVRAGFAMVIGSQDDLEVVGQAGDGGEAVERLAVTAADVVIMDVRMPRMDGVQATKIITERLGVHGPRVIVLTTFDLDEYAFAGLRAGASGFLLKNAPPDDLIAAIRTVAAGDAVVAPRVTRRLLETFAQRMPTATQATRDVRLAQLTDREREVLQAIAVGRSNQEIASALVLSEATVKSHVSRILTKLELRDRVQAVIFAYETKLVEP